MWSIVLDEAEVTALRAGERVTRSYSHPMTEGFDTPPKFFKVGTIVPVSIRGSYNDNVMRVRVVDYKHEQRGEGRTRIHRTYTYTYEALPEETEPPESDPGPQIDDEGGMSDWQSEVYGDER